jgi:hypothetical protein
MLNYCSRRNTSCSAGYLATTGQKPTTESRQVTSYKIKRTVIQTNAPGTSYHSDSPTAVSITHNSLYTNLLSTKWLLEQNATTIQSTTLQRLVENLQLFTNKYLFSILQKHNVLVLVSVIYQHCSVSCQKKWTSLRSQINYSTVKPRCIAAQGTMENKQ